MDGITKLYSQDQVREEENLPVCTCMYMPPMIMAVMIMAVMLW